MSVTLYTLPNCPQCTATKLYLDKYEITHSTIDLSNDAEASAYINSLGYKQAPVVVAGEAHWSGFRPDKIFSLSRILAHEKVSA
jgi:glutaredoxin-like protein NrdH